MNARPRAGRAVYDRTLADEAARGPRRHGGRWFRRTL